MKKFIAIVAVAVVIGLFSVPQASGQTKRFSVTCGFQRSAAIKSRDFRSKQFSASITLSFRLSRRISLNAGLSQAFERRPVSLRTGFSFRLF